MNMRMGVMALTGVAMLSLSAGAEEEAEKPAEEAAPKVTAAKRMVYTALPLLRAVEGDCEVCKPLGNWEKAEEGKFYPLGTAFRAQKDARLTLAFAADASVELADGAEIRTRQETLGALVRGIELVTGTVDVKLPDNLAEGAFTVAAPGFVAKNPAGNSRYVYEALGDGERVTVRCVTGALAIDGRHFRIPAMHAADEVVIRAGHDQLSTFLYGTSGDYVVKLDRGVETKADVDENGNRVEKAAPTEGEWNLSPKTKIVINRSVPSIGSRMSVHTMCFDAAGEMKSECLFCEGRAEINSGELVPKDASENAELAKRAAEAAETTEEAAADSDEESKDENKEEDKAEKKENASEE